MSEYSYITFMGKCNKSDNEFKDIQNKCLDIALEYKAQFNGLLRDITEETHTAFSGTFIFKCNAKDYTIISNEMTAKLEEIAFIGSVKSTNIQ